MSERAECDVRGEQRSAARQLRQQKHTQARTQTQTPLQIHIQQQQQPPPPRGQQGEASAAMATAGERRSLPSPQIVLGQPWSNWVDAAKLHGNDDMSIFGQCPARDDFFLVMCSYCGQVVKPQAFQAHYERRHGLTSKTPAAAVTTGAAAYPAPSLPRPGEMSGNMGPGRSATVNSTSPNSRILKSAKDKTSMHRRPLLPFKVLPDKVLTPAVKVEKIDTQVKLTHTTMPLATVSPPAKPSLNCSSVPKPPTLVSPGQLVNGKGLSLDKKQDGNESHKKQLHKRLPEREFNPDIHCGVLDLVARKPCTRSLTCKTHSLSQRRAVPGRRKRFDALLAEHKSKTRHRELQRSSEQPQQHPPLRDPHPTPSRLAQDHHLAPHSNGTTDTKASASSRPKLHNPSLPRLNSGSSHTGGSSQGDPMLLHGSPHHSTSTTDGASRLSSDEGENEEREECMEKLDFHYSGHHPHPAAFCTFGSRQLGRGCYTFNRRWDHVRSALSAMVDKHVNSHLWKKIPPAPENLSSATPHRTSTNSLPTSHSGAGAVGFQCSTSSLSASPYAQSFEGKPVLSYGTTLNARASPLSSADHPAYSTPSRQVSSSPQMPSGLSGAPSLAPSRPPKSKPSSKSFKFKEPSGGNAGGSPNCSSAVGVAKKRKNSSPLPSQPPYPAESSPSPSPSFRKNCVLNSGGSGSAHHPSLGYSSSSSTSSTHSGVHGLGFNCTPGRTNSLSLKQDQSGRGPPSGSPAESIKRMSVVMNSSDSTLSLGPFVHQGGTEQAGNSHGAIDGRPEGRKRKGPPASGSVHSGGGGPGPGRPKVPKSLAVNNIHAKHGRSIPGTQGLPNNPLLQQPKARP
ncbi:ataxin-7-like [Scleropages formosus]|uniref:Ataxin-7-like n=1 Tax=Scleropages formosus TaxID=113540 RepID=A0A0P7V492_SCLFO|nr:ataxin-7-like [Scleropages formosus]